MPIILIGTHYKGSTLSGKSALWLFQCTTIMTACLLFYISVHVLVRFGVYLYGVFDQICQVSLEIVQDFKSFLTIKCHFNC